SLHKWCGCHDVLAPADSVLLFRSKILHRSSNGGILPGSIDLHKTELGRNRKSLSVIKLMNLTRQHRLAQNTTCTELTATVNERWEESVLDSLASKVGEDNKETHWLVEHHSVFDASLKYSIHVESRAGKNKRKQETHLLVVLQALESVPNPGMCSKSYVCADLPLQLEIVLKPASTVERAWLVWLKSFHSEGQEWSVAPLARDVNLCSRSAWQARPGKFSTSRMKNRQLPLLYNWRTNRIAVVEQ
ncbi:hypothetical protein MUK42_27475, partial [Musa troglodytarum]